MSTNKLVDTMLMPATGRTRRHHTAEFKRQIVEACGAPGVSIAGVALANGLNANLVRRWRVNHGARPSVRYDPPSASDTPVSPTGEFIPVSVPPADAVPAAIRIELRQGASTVTVHWPLGAAADCAAWLRQWLR